MGDQPRRARLREARSPPTPTAVGCPQQSRRSRGCHEPMFRHIVRGFSTRAAALAPLAGLSLHAPADCGSQKKSVQEQKAEDEAARRQQYAEAMAWIREGDGRTSYAAKKRLARCGASRCSHRSRTPHRSRCSHRGCSCHAARYSYGTLANTAPTVKLGFVRSFPVISSPAIR